MARKIDTLVTALELDISSYKRSANEVKRINDSLKVGGSSFSGASIGGSSGAYKGAISGVAGAASGGSFAGVGAASLGVQRAQLTRLNAVHASSQANHRVLQQILLAVKGTGSGSVKAPPVHSASIFGSGISGGVIPRNRIGVIGRKKGGVASAVTHAVTDIDDIQAHVMSKGTFTMGPGGRASTHVGYSGPTHTNMRGASRTLQSGGIPLSIFNDVGNVFRRGGKSIGSAISSLIGNLKASISGLASANGGGFGGFAKGIGGGMMSGISAVGAAGAGGVAAFATAIVAGSVAVGTLSKAAFESYLEFDKMEASIGGALGSLSRGKEVMKELQNYAKTSSFSLKDIAASSVTLSAGGMNLAQSLPLAEKFAQALGGTPQDLEQVSSALLKVQGGSFGEAMEIFRKAGVSTSALKGAGVKITDGGQVESSSAEFLAALEKLSGPGTAVGGLADAVKNSSATKISNAGDAVEQVLTKLGSGIKDSILPMFDSFTTALSNLVENGTIDMVAESFSKLFNTLSENIDFGVIFDTIAGAFSIFADFMTEGVIPVISTVYNAIKGVIAGFGAIINWIGKIPGLGGIAMDAKKYWFDDKISTMESGKTSKEYLANKKRMDEKKKKSGKNVLDTSDSPNAQDGADAKKKKENEKQLKTAQDIIAATQNAYLARIANATEKALDIQAMILGGGRLAAQGISPNDLTNHRNRNRNAVRSDPLLSHLGLFVQTAIQNSNGY